MYKLHIHDCTCSVSESRVGEGGTTEMFLSNQESHSRCLNIVRILLYLCTEIIATFHNLVPIPVKKIKTSLYIFYLSIVNDALFYLEIFLKGMAMAEEPPPLSVHSLPLYQQFFHACTPLPYPSILQLAFENKLEI